MLLELFSLLLLFPVIAAGPAWLLASRLALEPLERVTAAVVLSLLGAYLLAWTVYLLALPLGCLWAGPALGAAGLFAGRRALGETLRTPVVRTALAAQVLITLWCLGWLMLVSAYSGGLWMADWFGHWQRTVFFLGQNHQNLLFNGFDPLTSRPPLVNVLVGAFLRDRPPFFASYQLIMTLLGCLAFLPAALLTNRWGGRRAVTGLALLFMLSPLFVQNATYAWTKLPAAFFVLASLHFFLRAREAAPPPATATLFSVSLALAILAHYSAGPYALLLAAGWWWLRPANAPRDAWARSTGATALVGGLVLATWFGWTLARFGFAGTFLTNTTVTDLAVTPAAQLQTVALNLRDTLVPHFLRTVDFTPLAQTSVSGWWRDWFFQLYQLNLFFAFGCAAWLVILRELIRLRAVASPERAFWLLFVPGSVILGLSVHSGRDPWGLVHICLQPLVLLGLAFLAAHWSKLDRSWQGLLLAGSTIDFLLGIFLHFGVQAGLIDRWLAVADPATGLPPVYSLSAQHNLQAKLNHQWVFVGDLFARQSGLILAGLVLLLGAALILAVRTPADSAKPT